jgi:hypothetical protein
LEKNKSALAKAGLARATSRADLAERRFCFAVSPRPSSAGLGRLGQRGGEAKEKIAVNFDEMRQAFFAGG